MAGSLTSTAAGSSADYQKYLYGESLKTDRVNEPTLLDFALVPWDGAFVKLLRGNYITFTSATYPNWFTGYITRDPDLELVGSKNGVGVWGYRYQATSDEYALNLQPIGTIPPFINTTQGAILKALAALLRPGLFDVTNVQAGQSIARYVVDPQKRFSDIVKEFADASYYQFWAKSGKLYFQKQDTTPAGIIIDGNDKHFQPSVLTLTPSPDPLVNDATVLGDVEPQNFVTEYFVGDGITAKFPLISSVYGVDSSFLLDDDFSASQIDNAKWNVYDTIANYIQASNGFLNALGGTNDNTYGVYIASANLIPIEGNLRITHGEYDFVSASSGVIGGLWTGAPASSYSGCLYGIECSKSPVAIANPAAPTVAVVGTAGTTSYTYFVVAKNAYGATLTSAGTTITTGNATLNGTNYNTITPVAVAGATSYDILKGNVNSLLGNTSGGALSDTGQATSAYSPNALNNTAGPNTVLKPITNGAVDGTQTLTVNYSSRYIIRTIIGTQLTHRLMHAYGYINANGTVANYGGTTDADLLTCQTYITEINPTTAAIIAQTVWINRNIAISAGTTFANYIALALNDLHCTVTGITISTPMQAALDIQANGATTFTRKIVGPNEIDSFDGLVPIATIADANNGAATKSSLLGTSQYNPGQAALTFFKDTTKQTSQVPQVGDIVRLGYRRAGAALARVQDRASVATEAAAWGDNGIRSSTRADLSPPPRNSREAEFAAAALVKDNSWQRYEGSYRCTSKYSVTSEPVSGSVLKFQNLPSVFPALTAEVIHEVRTRFAHSASELFEHDITFGKPDRLRRTLTRFTKKSDVYAPQDTAEIPTYVDVSAIGNSTALDVIAPTLVSYDANNLNFNTNVIPPTGGAFEVRYTDESWGADAGKNLITRTSPAIANPAAPTVAVVGSTGTTPYTYYVVAKNAYGSTLASAPTTITNGYAALGGGNYNTISFSAISGATSYDILKGNVNSLLGNTSSTTLNDIGQSTSAYSPNALNNTAQQTFAVPRNGHNKVAFIKAYDARNVLPQSEDLTASPWGVGGGVGAVTKSTQVNPDGKLSFICSAPFTATNQYVYSNAVAMPAAGTTIAFTASVKGPAGVSLILLLQRSDAPYTSIALTTVVMTGKWQRVTASATVPNGIGGAHVSTQVLSQGPGTVSVTRASVELGTLTETVYCKTDATAYGVNSRYAAALRVAFPLIPPAPTATLNISVPTAPVVNVTLPALQQDVWGYEIRASDNVTVLQHVDLINAGDTLSYTYANTSTRSLSFYVYTYNLLGEFSTAYNATASLPGPAATNVVVDEVNKVITWFNTNTVTYFTLEIDATDGTFTHDVVNVQVAGHLAALLDPDFFAQRWFRITPYDSLGAGTAASISHVYTPSAVVEFNANEVSVVNPPATPNSDPLVPAPVVNFSSDYIAESWKNYRSNWNRT